MRALVMDDALNSVDGAYPDMACKLFPGIVRLVAVRLNVPVEDVLGGRRTAAIASARHVAMWICYQVPRATCLEVGTFFSRDHSTVCNSVRVITEDRTLGTSLGRTAETLLKEAADTLKFEPKGF